MFHKLYHRATRYFSRKLYLYFLEEASLKCPLLCIYIFIHGRPLGFYDTTLDRITYEKSQFMSATTLCYVITFLFLSLFPLSFLHILVLIIWNSKYLCTLFSPDIVNFVSYHRMSALFVHHISYNEGNSEYSRTPLIRPPSESHWCGRIRGMVAREGFVYKQKALSVTRNVVVWEGWSLVRVVVRQGFYCTCFINMPCTYRWDAIRGLTISRGSSTRRSTGVPTLSWEMSGRGRKRCVWVLLIILLVMNNSNCLWNELKWSVW